MHKHQRHPALLLSCWMAPSKAYASMLDDNSPVRESVSYGVEGAIDRLRARGIRIRGNRIDYMRCPREQCQGIFVKYAMDAAACSECTYTEAYLD